MAACTGVLNCGPTLRPASFKGNEILSLAWNDDLELCSLSHLSFEFRPRKGRISRLRMSDPYDARGT